MGASPERRPNFAAWMIESGPRLKPSVGEVSSALLAKCADIQTQCRVQHHWDRDVLPVSGEVPVVRKAARLSAALRGNNGPLTY